MSNAKRQRKIEKTYEKEFFMQGADKPNRNDDIIPALFDIVARVDNIFPSGLPKDFLNKAFIEGEIITGKLPLYPLNGNSYDS